MEMSQARVRNGVGTWLIVTRGLKPRSPLGLNAARRRRSSTVLRRRMRSSRWRLAVENIWRIVRMPCRAGGAGGGQGVLRLWLCFDSLSTILAQDDRA